MTQRTRIEGSLDHRHQKQHLPFAFSVPSGATKLTIRFDYSPKISDGQSLTNDLSLTLFDPDGARGARHNNRDRNLTITAHAATPGYVPGALQPGIWTVWIDSHRLLPSSVVTFTFDIEISDEPVSEPEQIWIKGATAPRGPGWYRGDLHGHTYHSDASWDVPDFVQYGRDYKLDFVTLTDHNTISPLAQHDSYSADDLLTMGGMEMTTYYGHALALGLRQWLEWRVDAAGATMPELADRARHAGATYIIAHPLSVGDPFCTGCDWQYPDMMPGSARCVEVWNGSWDGSSNNPLALELWYSWLNQGYRMAATAGSDIHGPAQYTNVGFNNVYAEALREDAILTAIRQGHLYLSSGPQVELTGHTSQHSGMMGDLLAGDSLAMQVTWRGCADGDHLRLIVNGQVSEEFPCPNSGQRQWTLDAAQARWCLVEIRDAKNDIRAVTNPIFTGTEAGWR